MKAYREDAPARDNLRGTYMIIAAAVGVIVALLLYFGLRAPAEPAADASQQVIRDSELVAPAVTTAPAPAPAQVSVAAQDAGAFTERQLSPPVATVGAGAAPVAVRDEEGEALVIDGDLLEEIEDEAEAAPSAQ